MRILTSLEIFPPKDKAQREVLSTTREYVKELEARGVSPSKVKTDFETYYEILSGKVDSIAKKYGRTSSIDLYRLAKAVLRDYVLLDAIAEAEREGTTILI